MQATVNHGRGKVMVWGCMSVYGVGELVFIEPLNCSLPVFSFKCTQKIFGKLSEETRKI